MRIDTLQIKNFKGFAEQEFVLHPNFNLIVGINGSGKTSLLDALAIAASSWYLGIPEISPRSIYRDEIRLQIFERDAGSTAEPQLPCVIAASGNFMNMNLEWQRDVVIQGGTTRQINAKALKKLASETAKSVQDGGNIELPLFVYYGTGRLAAVTREAFHYNEKKFLNLGLRSRMAAYSDSISPTIATMELVRYFKEQTLHALQYNTAQDYPAFAHVKQAITACIEGANSVMFDLKLDTIILVMNDGSRQFFSHLSDGYRVMLAMVSDIARRMIELNPHLTAQVCQLTSGIVLIDELDLHLHPAWQRKLIENLRRTFPLLQFICTTHSPFLIQSLRGNEELIMLSGNSYMELKNMSLSAICEFIQAVPDTDASLQYLDMKESAKKFLAKLENASPAAPTAERAAFREELAKMVGVYDVNPAFQAFLELQSLAKLGE